MAEKLTMTTPFGLPQSTEWFIQSRTLSRGVSYVNGALTLDVSKSFVEIVLVGNNSHLHRVKWEGQTADTDIVNINKGNFTVDSLDKAIFNRLVANGTLSGTISGTPD